MPHELGIAILAGVGGMFGWGLADFFAKKAITEIGDMASLLWAHVFGTGAFGVLLAVDLLRGGTVSMPSMNALLLLTFFGILQAAVYIFLYRGFAKGQVSILGAVFASFPAITVILSILFFHEALNGILGVAVIFLGIVLLSVDLSALHRLRVSLHGVPGLFDIGVATILAALWTVLWDQLLGGKDWLLYAFIMYGVMTVAIWIIAKYQRTNLRISSGAHGIWVLLALIGFCESIAYAAISFGYSTTSYTSVIAMISGAFALPTIVLAVWFLKEKMSVMQVVGSVVVVLGIILIPFA